MGKIGEEYVVQGMEAECTMGSMKCALNTMTGHGIAYDGNALLNANDHMVPINFTQFGNCKLKVSPVPPVCIPVTPLAWMFGNQEHMIDGAPALTTGSMCPCMMGGVIKIVK